MGMGAVRRNRVRESGRWMVFKVSLLVKLHRYAGGRGVEVDGM